MSESLVKFMYHKYNNRRLYVSLAEMAAAA